MNTNNFDMKRIQYALLLLLAVLTIRVYGDIVMIDYIPRICVKIENLNDYPDIVVIGLSDCLAASRPNAGKVDSTAGLHVHKTCQITFYAAKKDYLEKKSIYKINWKKDKNVMKSSMTFDAKTLRSDIESADIYFHIAGFSEDSMIMHQIREDIKYKYGKLDIKK